MSIVNLWKWSFVKFNILLHIGQRDKSAKMTIAQWYC